MGREKHVSFSATSPSATPLPCRGFVLGVSFPELIAQAAAAHPAGLLFGFRKKTENLKGKNESKWGLVLFSHRPPALPRQLAGDSRQQMSREDKARHTLHQTLIIDGFCRVGLAFGFLSPLLLSLTFCVCVCVPSTRHPFESGSESGMTF